MTLALQAIKAEDLPLQQVFTSFYEVPSYQREYVWEEQQVTQLLEDINEEFSGSEGLSSEYFIGSMVALAKDGHPFDLIDGQQRMTTLFLILCALRERFKALGEAEVLNIIAPQISAASMNTVGQVVHRYRVELQYEDSQGVLKLIGAGQPLPDDVPRTRSVKNIQNAYTTICAFLESECKDADATRRFYGFLTNNVKLIRVQTVSMAHALKVFETINDRGVGLDSMDLLKNLLFMHARPEEFEELKVIWKGMVDALHKAGEKPLRFLRYFIFASYDVERLREEDIYEWLRKHEQETGYKSDPLGFARTLRSAALAYVRFASGLNVNETPNRYLENLRYLSGSAHQQLILLMAGRHLPAPVFDRLALELENLFFAYIIVREPTKVFEQTFAKWCSDLRAVNDEAGLVAFLQTHFVPAKEALSKRFDAAFQDLGERSVQRYRLRYILAKLAQYVDVLAKGTAGASQELKTFINSGVEIEHILPQSPTQAIQDTFLDFDQYDTYVRRLGNLTLLEKSINSSIGNGTFKAKRSALGESDFLLTRTLGKQISIGTNSAYDQALAKLRTFGVWQPQQIQERQDMLRDLAFEVWCMPPVQ